MIKDITYDENLSVKVELMDIKSYPIHSHPDFQIFYVLEGELSLTLFYATYRLQPGSIHIIHSEDVHSIKSITESNLVLVLSFDRDYFKSVFPHFVTTVFITNIEEGSFAKRDILRDQIFAIAAEDYDRSPGYVARINNAAVSLINTLMNNFRGFVIDSSEKAFVHRTSHDYMQVDRISRIIQFVYENYPYKISLSDIAEREHMSSYYLSHVFRKLVGVNFRDFLSMVRIEMSEVSVLSTDKSIAQISQDMGFSDAKYYVSHFYDHMGCHPKEYRRRYRDKVLGPVAPETTEYSLEKLKPIIGNFTQYPVFKKDIEKVNHIEMDFSAQPEGRFRPPAKNSAIFDDIYSGFATGSVSYDMSRIYRDILPQESAVSLLRCITEAPGSFAYPQINLTDRPDTVAGLLTPNGLRKPLYYLLEMLEKLPADIVLHGPNYLGLQDTDTKYLLIFNPEKDENLTVDIIARNLSSEYKVTKHKMIAVNSCLNFWAQLNFSSSLEDEDIENINYMSKPDIEFELIPMMEQYYTSIELAPYDIFLLKFTRY